MNNYEEKKQARIDRYRERAEKARQESNDFGGRFSTIDRSIAADKKAKYYEKKARAAENNNAISADDPEAREKLRDKLEKLKSRQEKMNRTINFYSVYLIATIPPSVAGRASTSFV